jgi:hypothetical protein
LVRDASMDLRMDAFVVGIIYVGNRIVALVARGLSAFFNNLGQQLRGSRRELRRLDAQPSPRLGLIISLYF